MSRSPITWPRVIKSLGIGLALPWLLSGCMGPLFNAPIPDSLATEENQPDITLVGDVAHPYGMNSMKVESVALLTGLDGTGEDPSPSPQRAALLGAMNLHEADKPNQILASPNTCLVTIRGFLRPGIQVGDRFDVEVQTPPRSDTTSLRDGWLMETRLTELAVLGGQIRKGHEMAIAEGPVLVDPSADSDHNPALVTRGRILGGGVALKARSLGLIIATEKQSVRLSRQLGNAINRRFHTYIDGKKVGIASPKTDEYIELLLHPRYKDNVNRFMRVLRSMAIREIPSAHQQRIELLSHQLLDPVTTAMAAIRLEAVGTENAIEVLKTGLDSIDPEVSFHAAEALAYLDETDSVEILTATARNEPAYRVNALAALSTMDDPVAYDALQGLLSVKSAETRYGAFRSLWAMAPGDPRIRGEDMNGQFTYHRIDVAGPPMIHVTRSHRPELVLFGLDHRIKLPIVTDAGKQITVNGRNGDKITISRFRAGQPTQQRVVPARVDDVVRAIVDLGGTYPDIVQFLQQANHAGSLSSRFRVNALPESGRKRDAARVSAPDAESSQAQIEHKSA